MVLNHLFVNGYGQTFEEFSALIGASESMKLMANHREKLEATETQGRASFVERNSLTDIFGGEEGPRGWTDFVGGSSRRESEVGRRDSEVGRRDSEVGSTAGPRRSRNSDAHVPRKQSLIRIKTALAKEKEEVRRILVLRTRGLKRTPSAVGGGRS